ncbi:Flp family type IVb pilin [Phyllobacterium salinisoli]|uniref:Flp family type IVb pilin n=1 Tax=Phyllobacterium salinisoli TaxID=1899321 RepID=A0A368K9E5_9HYPH|nr:Flp family type IVb pilin [Phyllobacterium salinisoli]RCS25022.1 Flp family type IVb pilin [Phyllobacterium salinisoli]
MLVLKRFLCDRTASAAIEYGLIGALVSVAILAGLLQLSASLEGQFDYVVTRVSDVMQ